MPLPSFIGQGPNERRSGGCGERTASRREAVHGLLDVTARAYVELLDAPACTISRVIGDLLVDLKQHQKDGGPPHRLGHGYLISDYPLTRAVIEERRPQTVSQDDPEPDENELKLLRELGYDALLMVAIEGEKVRGGSSRSMARRGVTSRTRSRAGAGPRRRGGEILKQLERPSA